MHDLPGTDRAVLENRERDGIEHVRLDADLLLQLPPHRRERIDRAVWLRFHAAAGQVLPASGIRPARGAAAAREKSWSIRARHHAESLDAERSNAGVETESSHRVKAVARGSKVDRRARVSVADHAEHVHAVAVVVAGIRFDEGTPEGVDLVEIDARIVLTSS